MQSHEEDTLIGPPCGTEGGSAIQADFDPRPPQIEISHFRWLFLSPSPTSPYFFLPDSVARYALFIFTQVSLSSCRR